MYDKTQVVAFADSIINGQKAIKDGFQLTEDSDEVLAIGMSFLAAVDEFKDDPIAAGLHLASRLTDFYGDARMNKTL